jgi:hypothetical protein
MPLLSIQQAQALERLLTARIEERLSALERLADERQRQPKPLRARNRSAVAEGERLREAIGRVVAAHPGPAEASAKVVLHALKGMDIGRDVLPSLRTVRWHLQQIRRGNGNTAALPSK